MSVEESKYFGAKIYKFSHYLGLVAFGFEATLGNQTRWLQAISLLEIRIQIMPRLTSFFATCLFKNQSLFLYQFKKLPDS